MAVINCGSHNCVHPACALLAAVGSQSGRQMNCQLIYVCACTKMIYGRGVSRRCVRMCVCGKHTRQIKHTQIIINQWQEQQALQRRVRKYFRCQFVGAGGANAGRGTPNSFATPTHLFGPNCWCCWLLSLWPLMTAPMLFA